MCELLYRFDCQVRELTLLQVFRDQEINIYEQLELGRYFGPLHKHATTPIPRIGLEEVHGTSIITANNFFPSAHVF